MSFQKAYEKFILPKYRTNEYAYDYDIVGVYDNPYKIKDRKDLTHLECYTIDPPNCKDPDDGFSYHNGTLYIHIVDPTEYFKPDSDTFTAIMKNGLTHYPERSEPDNMMPPDILKEAAFTDGIKRAITISTAIDPYTLLPIGEVAIEFTLVRCSIITNFTYTTARKGIPTPLFDTCMTVSKCMRQQRNGAGDKLAEIAGENPDILAIKQMIAEFAIFTNATIAQYLKLQLGTGLFRHFDADGTDWKNLTSHEMMKTIIDNGMSANYLTTQGSHDLLDVPVYCHFTSPLRRASDCICHFLVKAAYLNYDLPFTKTTLDLMATHLDAISKKERKIQHADRKFCFFEQVHDQTPFSLQFRVTCYTRTFFNIILECINKTPIQVSYTLRIPNLEESVIKHFEDNPVHTLQITTVNVPNKFDEGTLPELDAYIKNFRPK